MCTCTSRRHVQHTLCITRLSKNYDRGKHRCKTFNSYSSFPNNSYYYRLKRISVGARDFVFFANTADRESGEDALAEQRRTVDASMCPKTLSKRTRARAPGHIVLSFFPAYFQRMPSEFDVREYESREFVMSVVHLGRRKSGMETSNYH